MSTVTPHRREAEAPADTGRKWFRADRGRSHPVNAAVMDEESLRVVSDPELLGTLMDSLEEYRAGNVRPLDIDAI